MITSSLSKLQPRATFDVRSGQQVSAAEVSRAVGELTDYVTAETQRLFTVHTEQLYVDISNADRIGSANSFARQRGYVSDYKNLPREVKAKSRVNELVLAKLIAETASWVNNPNPLKKGPGFSEKINLGAVDKQMASLSHDESAGVLTLRWKVWDRELLLEFDIPEYVTKRNIRKWCLPSVKLKDGEAFFYFAVQEDPAQRTTRPTEVAGIDLGRTKAFHAGVVNKHGQRIADYKPSGRVTALNRKRENLLVEKKHIQAKVQHYRKLGILEDTQVLLCEEAKRKANKASRLAREVGWQAAADITRKLEKHNLNLVAVEQLNWVTGPKHGGRWTHSVHQSAIKHSLIRKGIRTSKRNAAGTSRSCWKCGTKLKKSSGRTAWCTSCKEEFDRDFNAALRLASKMKNTIGSARHSRSGRNCSTEPAGSVQVAGSDEPPVNIRSG